MGPDCTRPDGGGTDWSDIRQTKELRIKDQGSDQGSRIKDQGSRIGSRIKDQGRIKDQESRIKDQGGQGSRIGSMIGSRIKVHGPFPAMNEHPRRNTGVILRHSKAPLELFKSR